MKARISAYLMGLMWLGFGVMHFSMHDETVRQMPTYFPWKSFWVYLTGVAEIGVGIGLVPAATRRAAAFGAIGLLVIFTPAVIHIVVHDVEPTWWAEGVRAFFRWGLIPINVGIGLWAYALSRRTPAS